MHVRCLLPLIDDDTLATPASALFIFRFHCVTASPTTTIALSTSYVYKPVSSARQGGAPEKVEKPPPPHPLLMHLPSAALRPLHQCRPPSPGETLPVQSSSCSSSRQRAGPGLSPLPSGPPPSAALLHTGATLCPPPQAACGARTPASAGVTQRLKGGKDPGES